MEAPRFILMYSMQAYSQGSRIQSNLLEHISSSDYCTCAISAAVQMRPNSPLYKTSYSPVLPLTMHPKR